MNDMYVAWKFFLHQLFQQSLDAEIGSKLDYPKTKEQILKIVVIHTTQKG